MKGLKRLDVFGAVCASCPGDNHCTGQVFLLNIENKHPDLKLAIYTLNLARFLRSQLKFELYGHAAKFSASIGCCSRLAARSQIWVDSLLNHAELCTTKRHSGRDSLTLHNAFGKNRIDSLTFSRLAIQHTTNNLWPALHHTVFLDITYTIVNQ